MKFNQALSYFQKQPKKLFVIDGIGAILSTFSLGIVLVKLESFFGIPKSTLYFLALFPILFLIFDFYSYKKELKTFSIYLTLLSIMNLLYCILSIGLAIFHYQSITKWGWTYIILEVLIVTTLAVTELKVAKSSAN